MALSDYKKLITIKGTDLMDIVDDVTTANATVKASSLTNDVPYLKVTDKAKSATAADSATQLTGKSGVTAGTYGPSANVTVDGNTGSINIPRITVNAHGQVTAAAQYTLKVTTY